MADKDPGSRFALERITDEHDETSTRLVLRDLDDPRLLPLAVDFLSDQLLYRLRTGAGRAQPLARALGLRSARAVSSLRVLDATAGLGTDAFMMAALGCHVRAVERAEAVHALLEDGYLRLRKEAQRRAANTYETGPRSLLALAERLHFEKGDALDVLRLLREEECPDVVYLDPMYPEEGRSKSALPKKGMQMFRRLVGDDIDASELLAAALRRARRRVVVKRPLYARFLGERRPTWGVAGKAARFDIYLCGGL